MGQETTGEFARRLRQAIEGNPHAPQNLHGRQSWLRQRLKERTGREFSANTIHKWVKGTARPRPDAMRDLANVLKVDEVWLSLGRKPTDMSSPSTVDAATASGAALLVAGLIEVSGGRVSFPSADSGTVSLWANIGSARLGIVALTPQSSEGEPAFVVPEPLGDNTLIGIVPCNQTDGCISTACVDLIDLTEVPRENLGGFSVIRLERRKDRAFKIEGQRQLLRPLKRIGELSGEQK